MTASLRNIARASTLPQQPHGAIMAKCPCDTTRKWRFADDYAAEHLEGIRNEWFTAKSTALYLWVKNLSYGDKCRKTISYQRARLITQVACQFINI